ncbi:autotransporter outer membrane beta-barrel domain-containing protein [Methylomonas sp. EFPC3]|uniref:autotransporter outer membrane beta-barrel domain-containing protein n=1 Tax=Methylomonas sp. EFPC3 TaxID=3021710 RepID=UPI002416A260|nr:autotransporter outer membrane beta-barrel domain-containing protein [Methylomonas sp. EFPC3]WFP50102.1 autotransporter outer membrane beta-barrel domain-containing protein [Methylomonas sp. EFPC3]
MNNIAWLKKIFQLLLACFTLTLAVNPQSYADSGINTGSMNTLGQAGVASSGQLAVFQAISSQCGGPITTLQALCGSNSGVALQQLSPQAALQADSIAITSPYDFVKKINTRLQRLNDCDAADKTAKDREDCRKRGGGSGDASYIGPFGISISGGGGFGDRNNVRGQTGFDVNTQHANAILDYRFDKQFAGGLSLGYLHSDRDLNFNSGYLNSDAYRVAPFLVYSPSSQSYVSVLAGYSRLEFDSLRSVNASLANNVTIGNASASYGADQFFTSLGAGYIEQMEWFNLRGFVRGDYSHTEIDGYTEQGAAVVDGGGALRGSAPIQMNGQAIDSFTTTVGAELSRAFSVPSLYTVFIPRFRAEWVHEFENRSRQINASLAGTVLNPITTGAPERNWVNLATGVQMLLPQNITAFVDYEALLIENGSNQIVSGGVKIQF